MLDDDEILELVRDATAVDELAAMEEGRASLAERPKPKSRRTAWWLAGAGTVAALIAVLALLPNPAPVQINDLRAEYPATRGPEAGWRIVGSLSEPAYVCAVVIDERMERWILPVQGGSKGIWQRQEGEIALHIPSRPIPVEVEGSARSRYLMLLASPRPALDAADLLDAISDPVAAPRIPEAEVEARLAEIAHQLKARFEVDVRILRLP